MSSIRIQATMTILMICAQLAGLAHVAHCQPAGERNIVVEGAAKSSVGRRWALIVTVNSYQDAQIPDLRFCDQDGQLIAEVLANECGYDRRDIVRLSTSQTDAAKKPTRANLMDEVRFIARKAEPEDVVMVFFSGHGFLGNDGAGYLLLSDCRRDDVEKTGLATSQLRDILSACPTKQKLLVLDCCHAGGKDASKGPTGEDLGAIFRDTPGLLTLASCRAGESSWEWAVKKQGLFTYHFVEGLRGEADSQFDGIVNSAELYTYVRNQVLRTAEGLKVQQTPVQIVGAGEVPVFSLSKVVPKVYFEDFSEANPGSLPSGWKGKGLSVQLLGAQPTLQLRQAGLATVQLPAQKVIRGNFKVNCAFDTNGYVDRARSFLITLADRQRNPRVQVTVLDQYPNCHVTVNGKKMRADSLSYKDPNQLTIRRVGRSIQVIVNGKTIQAFTTGDEDLPYVTLGLNCRVEPVNSVPMIFSLRAGP